LHLPDRHQNYYYCHQNQAYCGIRVTMLNYINICVLANFTERIRVLH
jgi:hypothetical protein